MKMNKLGAAAAARSHTSARTRQWLMATHAATYLSQKWTGHLRQVVTAVSKFLMEQGYGCSVQKVPSSTVPALTSLAETGEPDILTEVWANSTPSYEPLLAEGKLVELANVLSDGGVEAWWIPAYLAESNPELTTWEGIMANPAAVGGKFHDCPSGWACDIINNNNLKAAGIEGTGLERFQHGSGETLADIHRCGV